MSTWRDVGRDRRRAQQVIRGQLVAGVIPPERALADTALENHAVARVIQWLPGWGIVRTHRMLADLLIFANRRCGDLTDRQRHELAVRIRRGPTHREDPI